MPQQMPSPFTTFLQKPPAQSSFRAQRSPFAFALCAWPAFALAGLARPDVVVLDDPAFAPFPVPALAVLDDPAAAPEPSARIAAVEPAEPGSCIAALIIAPDPALGCTMQWPLTCAVPG